jgi:hypothetical protein
MGILPYFTRILAFVGLFTLLSGCVSDYRLSNEPSSPSQGSVEELEITDFRDCTQVLSDYYWYEDHEFGAILLYDGCLVNEYNAYLIIEHEFWDMEASPIQVEYETLNGDVMTVDAWKFTLEFWYNPVDIELQVIPYSGDMAAGIHEFGVNCVDDDQSECDVEHMGSVSAQDFE